MTLHAKQLNITGAKWVAPGGQECEAEEVSYNLKQTKVTLTFENPIPTGDAQLIIDFSGILNNDMAGFYRSSYKTVEGVFVFSSSTGRCLPLASFSPVRGWVCGCIERGAVSTSRILPGFV